MGTGTSQGVPMIAQPEVPGACNLGDARNWRTRAAVHVVMDGFHLQVDAGPEFRLQCLHNRVEALDLFFLTHSHADHILGMDDMRRFCDLRGYTAIPVYSSPAALQRVREIFPYAVREQPVEKGYPAFSLREMPAVLECPGGRIEAVLLPHGPMEVLGLVFTERGSGAKFTYYTDCSGVGEEARALARGSAVVVLDGLRMEPHPTHMHIPQAVEVARAIGSPRTYLTHMTFMVDHAAVEGDLPPEVRLAYDGLRLRLGAGGAVGV